MVNFVLMVTREKHFKFSVNGEFISKLYFPWNLGIFLSIAVSFDHISALCASAGALVYCWSMRCEKMACRLAAAVWRQQDDDHFDGRNSASNTSCSYSSTSTSKNSAAAATEAAASVAAAGAEVCTPKSYICISYLYLWLSCLMQECLWKSA